MAGPLAGSTGLGPLRFFIANLLGAVVYVPIAVGAGYAIGYGLGDRIEGLRRFTGGAEHVLLAAIAVAALGLWLWRRGAPARTRAPDANSSRATVGSGRRDRVRFDDVSRSPRMTRRNRLADLLRFYGNRPRPDDARDPVESERDWIDVDAEDDGDGDPEAGLPLARTFGPGTRPLTWKEHLGALRHAMDSTREDTAPDWPPGREVLYVVDPAATIAQGALVLEVLARDPRKRGGFTQLRRLGLRRTQLAALPDAADRRDPGPARRHPRSGSPVARQPPELRRREPSLPRPAGPPRQPDAARLPNRARVAARVPRRARTSFRSAGTTARPSRRRSTCAPIRRPGTTSSPDRSTAGAERVELSAVRLLLAGGLVFAGERVARLDDARRVPLARPSAPARRRCASRWRRAARSSTRSSGSRACPASSSPTSSSTRRSPRRRGPASASARRPATGARSGCARRSASTTTGPSSACDRDSAASSRRIAAASSDGTRAPSGRPRRASGRRASASAPCTRATGRARHSTCPRETWRARWASSSRRAGTSRPTGKLYRQPGAFKLEVQLGHRLVRAARRRSTSAARSAQLPELLAALRRGESIVLLGDGTLGMLPEEWLRQLRHARRPRRRRRTITCASGAARSALLDALLAAQPEVAASTRPSRGPASELRALRGHRARATRRRASTASCAPTSATGSAGCDFLERFGFGGCLADDMGLGKTVQVLALLESRRAAQPRDERPARRSSSCRDRSSSTGRRRRARFTPAAARARPHRRAAAHARREHVRRLRPGAHHLRHAAPRRRRCSKDVAFDYVILDEAQAIKNADDRAAKAARLLRGRPSPGAVSGTPVENHLGELWSLFEFLNPGMLGAASRASSRRRAGAGASTPRRAALARARRCARSSCAAPRSRWRTDLPAKTEQTIFCELEPRAAQALRRAARPLPRGAARQRRRATGSGESKIQVLEALLRLRQAACHPGPASTSARRGEPSAKLDAAAAAARARSSTRGTRRWSSRSSRACSRSCATRLDAARHRLRVPRRPDARPRGARSSASRTTPTARSSYQPQGRRPRPQPDRGRVRLPARPWWNPAVEAQAIDRAHRIGQTRHVFAYRLIARDTVEEKVLELQETKRALADAIITADDSLIRTLTREDLELLLS